MSVTLYLRRAVKSVLYIAIIFLLVFGLIYVLSETKDPNMSFFDFTIPKHNRLYLLGFILIFGLFYPFITFIKKNVYLSRSFEEDREGILLIFETSGYEKVSEEGTKIYFRPKSKLSRFMRMMEDTVELDYSDNPIVLNGMRKETYRLGKHIEYMSTRQSMDE